MLDTALLQDLVDRLRVPVKRYFISPSEISLRELIAYTEVLVREEFGFEVRVRVEHTFLGFSVVLRDDKQEESFISFALEFDEKEETEL
jgi:hypothetical protein